MDVKKKLATARGIIRKRVPYLSTAVLMLVPREAPGIGTTAVTENMILLYDPKTIEEWSIEDVATALVHEVGHVIRNHIGRAKRFGIHPQSEDAAIWNYAGDACINSDLVASGFKLLTTDVTYQKLGSEPNKTVEELYRWLKDQGFKKPNGEGDGEGDGGSSQKGRSGNCGSGCGHKHDSEDKHTSPDDPDNRTKAEVNRSRRQVAEAVRDQANQKGVGSVPGGWLKWANMTLKPQVIPWEQEFAREFRRTYQYKAGAVDYKYQGMSKHQAGVGYGPGCPVLPKLLRPIPDVEVVIDTSGSMGPSALEKAVSEVKGVISAVGAQVAFMACDATVQATTKITKWQDVKRHLKGGGGTDFRPIFEEIRKRRSKPEILVFLTDGYGPAPEVNPIPGLDVICVLIEGEGRPANWWKYIVYNGDRKDDSKDVL